MPEYLVNCLINIYYLFYYSLLFRVFHIETVINTDDTPVFFKLAMSNSV